MMNHYFFTLLTLAFTVPASTIIATATWGKTHFIVGYKEPTPPSSPTLSSTACPSVATPFGLMHENHIKAVYFAPDDDVRGILLHLIEHEKKSIRAALFTLTEKRVAQALVEAHKRGICVEIITDQSNVYGRYTKVPLLHQGKVKVFVYNPEHADHTHGIMHHKFFLFEDNIQGKMLLWTGSFNATCAACDHNQENVLVCEDQFFVAKFNTRFNELKNLCDHYKPLIAVSNNKKSSKQKQSKKTARRVA